MSWPIVCRRGRRLPDGTAVNWIRDCARVRNAKLPASYWWSFYHRKRKAGGAYCNYPAGLICPMRGVWARILARAVPCAAS